MALTITFKKITSLSVGMLLVLACAGQQMDQDFVSPPKTVQTSVYWYWMSDNISKEGVVKDLKAMKSVGINRAFIGNIGYPSTPYGKVKIFSEEWWDILHTALKTATELDIEIGIFNSPGWSQSGGPWIKPEQAMRYLTSTDIAVTGPKQLYKKLDKPAAQFQDVRLLAFPAPKKYHTTIADLKPVLSSLPVKTELKHLIDDNTATEVTIEKGETLSIDFKTASDFTARSMVVYPAQRSINLKVDLQVKKDGSYQSIRNFSVKRTNADLHVGFNPYGPVAVSIPATSSRQFRIVFSDSESNSGIAEIKLSSAPRVENYVEKTLAKMYQSPLPYWNEYQWPQQPVVNDQALVINPGKVLDISGKLSADGMLKWDVPAGDWVIMRAGMTPTGVTNGPASPEATGLEVDKMSKSHVAAHFDAFLGEIMRRIPEKDRRTWKVAVQDSYETGGQNWTDELVAKFKKQYGYDPIPYIPVIQGMVVGSAEQSDRFLWDLRRLIADCVAYDYVGGLRAVSHKHGLTTWLENYGHWGFPGEFLQYGGQSDEIGGEFWSEGELGNIENRAASSAAHIYGKNKVSAESFTAGGKHYARYPAVMKQRGDRFFTEGINNTLLHVFIQQPDERQPGVNANFGNEFNRNNTWFTHLDSFIAYLKRCNYMLQQGKYVADVAYFIGEDAPKMTGICDPELPKGYSFDYINAEVIKTRLKVKDGKLVLPDGMSYSILVLPKLETMRPELLQKIKELVKEGAVILGPAPKRSPSLQGYPAADAEVLKLSAELWGRVDGNHVKSGKYGKGTVLSGMDMQTALNFLHIKPDFAVMPTDPVLFIHRKEKDKELYFISNQSESAITIAPSFRIEGKQPELWDAVTGLRRKLPAFSQQAGLTRIPLKLDALQSVFIVFTDQAVAGKKGEAQLNFPEPIAVKKVDGPWTLTFEDGKRGPLKPLVINELTDWTKSADDAVKYFSGKCTYTTTLNLNSMGVGEQVYLSLGQVGVMAKIKVNGFDAGSVWTAPWEVDISKAAKPGENKIEIEVVNNWMNRLIGDSKLPAAERKTWTSQSNYSPKSPLQPSGLIGPVLLKYLKYDDN